MTMSISNDLSMYYGAPSSAIGKARELRAKQTEAEKLLWEELKRKQPGVKFRRQHPINIYIVDFYCHTAKLVIEIDGDYHLSSDQQLADNKRTEEIRDLGIEVIRFTNHQIQGQMDEVINAIKVHITRRIDIFNNHNSGT
jgi:very-short-patch-repair endonuclease